MHNLLFCAHTLCMNYVTNTFLLPSSSVRSKQLLCFVHCQGQKTYNKELCRISKPFPSINYDWNNPYILLPFWQKLLPTSLAFMHLVPGMQRPIEWSYIRCMYFLDCLIRHSLREADPTGLYFAKPEGKPLFFFFFFFFEVTFLLSKQRTSILVFVGGVF